jgi:hypothetical protein
MGLRNFRDNRGSEWRVWDVRPYRLQHDQPERRMAERRRADGNAHAGRERRTGQDRRGLKPGFFTPGLEAGWLCFEGSEEKRRLTPIPPGWDEAPEARLEEMLDRSSAVGPRRGDR